MLVTATNALVRVLLTPACAACDAPLDRPLGGPVCAACWRAVPRITPPVVRAMRGCVAHPRAAGPWCARCRHRPSAVPTGAQRRPLRRIAAGDRARVQVRAAGGCWPSRWRALMREAGADLLAGADAAVPVPLHPWRALRRGFNQADDLARQLGLPVWRVLRRRRHGPPQASLPADRRRRQRARGLRAAPDRPMDGPVVAGSGTADGGPCAQSCPGAGRRRDDDRRDGRGLRARAAERAGARRVSVLTAARAVAAPRDRPPRPRRPSTAPRR